MKSLVRIQLPSQEVLMLHAKFQKKIAPMKNTSVTLLFVIERWKTLARKLFSVRNGNAGV